MIEYRNLRIALLGAGNVGGQVARLLVQQRDVLASRIGAGLELVGVLVRDPDAPRDLPVSADLYTTDADTLIAGADIVVELMGGIEPARTYVLQALSSGADVITGNKALLALHGPELFEVAEQVGAQLYYEAAVGGAIPIIRPLRESLAGDRVERIIGIVNGTTNFILDRMDRLGEEMADALAVAQELGYAEADPTADVGGYDAAQKAAILASLAFHTSVPLSAVHREGIEHITRAQVEAAKHAGYVLKLLAIAERMPHEADGGRDGIAARVHPALIPAEHPLATVRGAFNAIFVEAEAAGELMFYGAGAGGLQTASAVLGDLVSAARRHVAGGPGVAESTQARIPVLGIDRVVTRYQITLEAVDRPGVLAEIATIVSNHGVSVETVQQSTEPGSGSAELVVGTHAATEAALAATVAELESSDVVTAITSVLRVEGVR